MKEANAICLSAERERNRASADLPDGDGSDEAEVVVEALVSPVKEMNEELRELGPPNGEAKQVGAIVAAFEAGVAKAEASPEPPDSVVAFTKANRLALEYGLVDCQI